MSLTRARPAAVDSLARQQRLAAGSQRDIELVALLVGGDAHQLVQFGNGLVALVHQVVGRLAAGLGAGSRNLLVQVIDAGQVVVGLFDHGANLGVQAQALVLHFLVGRTDLGRQAVGLAQHVRARGRVGGRIGGRVHAGEEARKRRRDADGAIREQVVDLRNLIELRLQLGAAALRADQLLVQEAVVAAHDGVHLDAAPDEAVAGGLGAGGRGHDALAVVADRGGVVDIVAGRGDARLRSVQTAQRQFIQIHADIAPFVTAAEGVDTCLTARIRQNLEPFGFCVDAPRGAPRS